MYRRIYVLRFKNKKAAAFGTYGWSGESVGIITTALKEACLEVVSEGLKVTGAPHSQALDEARDFGKTLARI